MKILEDVVTNAKSVANELSKKAGKAIDISKLKISAAETTADINKKFKELGNLVFLSKREGADNEIAIENIMNEIEALYDVLDSVNDELVALRSKKICPICKGENPAEALFCNACGSSLFEAEEEKKNEEVVAEEAPVQEEAAEEVAAEETTEE